MSKVNIEGIPSVLKEYKQWVVWKYVQKSGAPKPTKPLYSPKTKWITSHHPKDYDSWGTFEEAISVLDKFDGIGFVLTENDPFCVIDLDKAKQDSDLALQNEYWDKITSYSETSPSGEGAHIWLKGSVKQGRKRYSTEIYSSLRYITVTGHTIYDGEIAENQEVINELWERLSSPVENTSTTPIRSPQGEVSLSDVEIIDRAMNAANGAKFKSCWNGEWQGFYGSASESDYALIDMLAFYTKNDDQVSRIFLDSPAGRREFGYVGSNPDKYKGNSCKYHIDRMIKSCRDKSFDMPEINMAPIMLNIHKQIAELNKPKTQQQVTSVSVSGGNLYPPGIIGEIASAIYNFAPRPVEQIALVGALGFMAGICGRCYNINGMGLNQYLLLVAPSSVGKEAMSDGADMLYNEIEKIGVHCDDFIGPSKISSEQALIRRFDESKTKSMLATYGEIGKELQKISNLKQSTSSIDMGTILLRMHHASGKGKIFKSVIYADKSKDTKNIKSPAFSILGQAVPGQVYKGITEEMVTEGLISRFLFSEYDGKRVPLNRNMVTADIRLIEKLVAIVSNSIMLNENDKVIDVKMNSDAEKVLYEFDEACDSWINGTDDEMIRSLWGKAYANCLKLAGLIAVGKNYLSPTIDDECATWAVAFVKKSVRLLSSKAMDGEFGANDKISLNQNQVKVMRAVKNWFTKPLTATDKIGSRNETYKEHGIIPLRYLQQRCALESNIFKSVIESLVSGGDLMRVDNRKRKELQDKYKWSNIMSVELFTVSEDYKFD